MRYATFLLAVVLFAACGTHNSLDHTAAAVSTQPQQPAVAQAAGLSAPDSPSDLAETKLAPKVNVDVKMVSGMTGGAIVTLTATFDDGRQSDTKIVIHDFQASSTSDLSGEMDQIDYIVAGRSLHLSRTNHNYYVGSGKGPDVANNRREVAGFYDQCQRVLTAVQRKRDARAAAQPLLTYLTSQNFPSWLIPPRGSGKAAR